MGIYEVLEWDKSGSPPSQEAWKILVLAGQPRSGCSREPRAPSLVEPSFPARHPHRLERGGRVCVRPGGDALAARACHQRCSQQREKRPFPLSLFLVKCLETDCYLGYISPPQSRLSLKIEAFAYLSTRPPSCTQEGRLSGSSVTELSPVVQCMHRVLELEESAQAARFLGGCGASGWGAGAESLDPPPSCI